MATLRGRVTVAFIGLGLTLLLALGGSLFLVLRDLHTAANEARLADTISSIAITARARLAGGASLRDVLEGIRSELGESDLRVLLIGADGQVVAPLGEPLPVDRIDVSTGPRGALTRGTFRVAPGLGYVYVATSLRTPDQPGPARALVIAIPDRAGRQTLQDLLRTLPLVALVLVAAGVPMAYLLSRSVSGPLRRLGQATGILARGDLPPILPVDGPREVAEVTGAFNAMTTEVARTRRAQADLVANVRHDLRTPLTVIGGFAAALADGTASGDDARRAAAAISEEAARLEALVDQLGALADLDAAQSLRIEHVDAATLVREAVIRFEAMATARGQTVVARAPSESIRVAADRGALERILANLVANALAAAPADGGHAWIEASTAEGGDVILAVTDDGPGIPPATLPRVFERFYRGSPARSGRGSGLGLAIVAELARAHGGRAFAENVAGGGARVGVRLPAQGAA